MNNVATISSSTGADYSDKILTAPKGEFNVGEEVRNMLCYFEDGRLLVSRSHANNTHVLSFEAQLRRLGRHYHKQLVDIEDVHSAYTNNAQISKRNVESSDMMNDVMTLLKKGVAKKASDIHIRWGKTVTKVWFRIHGDLVEMDAYSSEYGFALLNTIYTSMTDVSDTAFKPKERQDARIAGRDKVPEQVNGVRVATSPTTDGLLMVLRLLYNDAGSSTDLRDLGWSPADAAKVQYMKSQPTGINIICGPTGSGKSTTLQRIMTSILAESDYTINLITVEDPPEYPIPGSIQTPVTNCDTKEERSQAFQSAISAAMRLDPDVIMIGEVRDEASAELALQAAMTGHQVWTTIHANSAPAIIDRLIDLKLPITMVADHTMITGLTCQRLVKLLCPHCRVKMIDAMDALDKKKIRRVERIAEDLENIYVTGKGCDHCDDGTIGRTALEEVILPDPKFMEYIRDGKKLQAVDYWRKQQGSKTMLDHAIEKVNLGLIDPFAAESVVGLLTNNIILDDNRIEDSEVNGAI